jgi:LmbE family N-acetylglucosaminyl deacetylase
VARVRHNRWVRWAVLALVVAFLFEGAHRLAQARSLYLANLRSNPVVSEMPEPTEGDRIVIFAPHEDDETLGCAGYIQRAVAAGAHLRVVLMTNGEYPELSVVLFEEPHLPSRSAFIALGYQRQKETLAALARLGVPASQVTFLGYPNNYLDQMWLPSHWSPQNPVRSVRTRATRSPYANSFTPNAVHCGSSVLRDVETILEQEKPTTVISLHPNDIHVDHWPTYAFVQFALEELALRGESFAQQCKLYLYLIHRPHWPTPRRLRPWLSLDPPAPLVAVGQTQWLAFPLGLQEAFGKYQTIRIYRTQGGGIDPLLSSFARVNELYGQMKVRPWPPMAFVPSRVLIIDPTADTDLAMRYPAADIHMVSLARADRHMLLDVLLRGKVSNRIGLHVTIHAGGATEAQRTLAEYHWQGSRAEGALYRNGVLHRVPPEDFEASAVGKVATLVAPWPLPNDRPAFALIRVWTTRGRRTLDQTAATLLRVP